MHYLIFTSCIDSYIKYINESIITGIYFYNYENMKSKTYFFNNEKDWKIY